MSQRTGTLSRCVLSRSFLVLVFANPQGCTYRSLATASGRISYPPLMYAENETPKRALPDKKLEDKRTVLGRTVVAMHSKRHNAVNYSEIRQNLASAIYIYDK